MRSLEQFLRLEPPPQTIANFAKPCLGWYRYLNPKYIPTERELPQALWRLFDGDYQWDRRGRFAGSNLNTGLFFGRSLDAAKAEMYFYRDEIGPFESSMPFLDAQLRYSNVLNLTEGAAISFVFEQLLEFPYRRSKL